MKGVALHDALTQYESGKKCAASVTLTPQTDLSKLPMSTLKQLLADRNVQCKVSAVWYMCEPWCEVRRGFVHNA